MGISWFHRIISGSGRREEQREVQSRDQEEARRFCIAIKQPGTDQKGVLYTGDSVVDAKTAAGAGADFAGVLTGTKSSRDFEPFDHVCIAWDLEELLKALKQEK